MIYIVDGTGDFFDSHYAGSMAVSHCSVTYHLNKSRARYWRGPDTLDVIKSTSGIAWKVLGELLQNEFPAAFLGPGQRQAPRSPIILVGYSRGGAAVVMVAKMLAERSIPVSAMFLFDAVSKRSRDSSIDVDKVPGNVRVCRHAVRNEGAQIVLQAEERALWKKCERAPGFTDMWAEFTRVGSGQFEDFLAVRSRTLAARHPELARAVTAWLPKSRTLKAMRVAMRNSYELGRDGASVPFGNCAREFDPACDYEEKSFAGTHAALGGVPWTTLGKEIEELDRAIERDVWTWMSGHMLRNGVRASK